MTETLISLISILTGIITTNLFGYFKKNYAFGLIGNTITGVFGSILILKSFGRLGFNPWAITRNGNFEVDLFLLNIIISAIGGILGLIFIRLMTNKLKK